MDFEAFKQKLRTHTLPVVVDVWAPWCAPCRFIEPSLRRLAEEYDGRVDLWKINADENRELVQALKIYGIPTTLVFQGEREIMRTTGAQPQSSLAKMFEAALSGEPVQKAGISLSDRVIRVALGLGLVLVTLFTHQSILWYALGGIILFTAVYDRCPIWQALSPHLSRLIKRVLPSP